MKILAVIIFCLFHVISNGQFSRYIVSFKDKNGSPFTITDPSKYLSSRSIERRIRQKISIDETDLPIAPAYLDSIKSTGVIILNKSKWLNQVCIYTTDPTAINKINTFPFVITTTPVRHAIKVLDSSNKFVEHIANSGPIIPHTLLSDFYDYGNAYPQIHIHEGEFLHNNGFHGEGMVIGIIDAGFFHYQSNPSFDSIRNNNQINDTYDFVNNKVSVNEEDSHGMRCFSIIASNIPGKLIGSCPKATFNLYKSEDVNSEYPIEEQNWVSAAERADSIGVDILSTSLGYTTFDNPIFNHTYQDMNGKTTIIARANVLAAKKGIISVVAAGNEGNSTWHFISSPADADHVLTVGAVSTSGQPASFSSYGPTSDGRVKPDVASVGVATATSSPSGAVVFGNGTSFATPNIAGLTTCLWQAFQDFTNLEIIDAIKKSSSIYNLPDDRIGYGIPNFHIAYDILTLIRSQRNMPDLNKDWIRVYPNPFPGNFYVAFKPKKTGNAFITVYDESGKMYDSKNIATIEGQSQNIFFNIINATAKSIYYVEYNDGTNKRSIRIMRR